MKYLLIICIFLFGCDWMYETTKVHKVYFEPDSSVVEFVDAEVIIVEVYDDNYDGTYIDKDEDSQNKSRDSSNTIITEYTQGQIDSSTDIRDDNRNQRVKKIDNDIKNVIADVQDSGTEEDTSIELNDSGFVDDTFVEVDSRIEEDTSIESDSSLEDTFIESDSDLEDSNIEDAIVDSSVNECSLNVGYVYDCSPKNCDNSIELIPGNCWAHVPLVISGYSYSILLSEYGEYEEYDSYCETKYNDMVYTLMGTVQPKTCAVIKVEGNRGIINDEIKCYNSDELPKCLIVSERENFNIIAYDEYNFGWVTIQSKELDNFESCPYSCD